MLRKTAKDFSAALSFINNSRRAEWWYWRRERVAFDRKLGRLHADHDACGDSQRIAPTHPVQQITRDPVQ